MKRVGVSARARGVVRGKAGGVDFGELVGYREYDADGVRVSVPRVSAAEGRRLQEVMAEEDPFALEELVGGWPDDHWTAKFKATRKVIRTAAGYTAVVPRLAGLNATPMGAMGTEGRRAVETYERYEPAEKLGSNKPQVVKTYTLDQVFADPDVTLKMDISAEFLQLVKRHAVLDPNKACVVLRDALKGKGLPNHRITPGNYANSWRAAKDFLLSSVPANRPLSTDVMVIGREALAEGVTDGRTWTVVGPVNLTEVVAAVHSMVVLSDARRVSAMFEWELSKLGVQVIEQRSSVFEQHVGLAGLPSGLAVDLPERLKHIATAVVPVEGDDGRVCASAVRFGATTAVVNQHVVRRARAAGVQLTIANSAFEVMRQCGEDLYEVSHLSNNVKLPSLITRVPMVGSPAMVLAAVPGGHWVSSPTTVFSTPTGVVNVKRVSGLQSGLSGALLTDPDGRYVYGVYHGSSLDMSVFSSVGGLSAEQPTVVESATLASNAERAVALYGEMTERGLHERLMKISKSACGLACRQYGVTAFSTTKGVITTQNPRHWDLSFPSGQICVEVQPPAEGRFFLQRRDNPFTGLVRKPVEREMVAFMCKTELGQVFLTPAMPITDIYDNYAEMLHPGPCEKSIVSAIAFAVSDAAVVGLYSGLVSSPVAKCRVVFLDDIGGNAETTLQQFAAGEEYGTPRGWSVSDVATLLESGEGMEGFKLHGKFLIDKALAGQSVADAVLHAPRAQEIVRLFRKWARNKLKATDVLEALAGVARASEGDSVAYDMVASWLKKRRGSHSSDSLGLASESGAEPVGLFRSVSQTDNE
jgi:hypothetical protein